MVLIKAGVRLCSVSGWIKPEGNRGFMGQSNKRRFFGLFGRRQKEQDEVQEEDLELYNGMQVEVTGEDGQILLVAQVLNLEGDQAQLKPQTEGDWPGEGGEPVPVTLRGYSSQEGKAVVLKGAVRPREDGLWEIERLSLVKRTNDRAFFRIDTNIDAGVTLVGSFSEQQEQCKVLNLSVGGVCVGSKQRHNVGDKFILQVQLLPGMESSLMFCQVLRILECKADYFEYGCQFLQMTAADEERILQVIFDLQRKRRG